MGNKKYYPDDSTRRPFAKRSLGQNFLADSSYARKIVRSLGLSSSDTVLEIGPGRGALTGLLAEQAGRVIAVEIDRELVPELRECFAEDPAVEIVEADFLKIAPRELFGGESPSLVKVAANLPYYISTPILRKLFDDRDIYGEIVVMLQKEVAERIAAPPGSSDRGFLTVVVDHGFECEILFDVPPGAFRPIPKVESSVVRLIPRKADEPDGDLDRALYELASAGFRQKRKTLKNNFKGAAVPSAEWIAAAGGPDLLLASCGVAPSARAEDVTREEWRALALKVSR